MKKHLSIAFRMTIATMLLLGVLYPLAVTGLAQLIFHDQANGELIHSGAPLAGSRLIGQSFASPAYFHSRPSGTGGAGYDAQNSSGSNLAPSNKALISRTEASIHDVQAENPGVPVPIDLVTASGSGLDPDISPAAAAFQIPRVAQARHTAPSALQTLVAKHTKGRQLGFLGEPRVNVLELNLELDALYPLR